MEKQDFTKLIEASIQVATELKNYHPHISVMIAAGFIVVNESVAGIPIDEGEE